MMTRNFLKLTSGEVGFSPVDMLKIAYEVFGEAYFQVTQDMPHESFKALIEITETTKDEKS